MKKTVDDKGQQHRRVSIIDIIVLVVVVALAVGFYIKFYTGDTPFTSTETVEVTYTLKISATRMTIADVLLPGDTIYVPDPGAYIGTITNVEFTKAESPELILDGTYVVAPIEDRYDLWLTVKANCTVSNSRYYINKIFELKLNSSFRMLTKYFDTTGIVMSITLG